MAEANQLLPGFNHNVKRQGKLYHVQTEDSGTANPHVTTHLFLGGNILASKRASYSDALGAADLATRVKKMMEAQHKDMLRQLVRGAFDEVESHRTAHARAYAPGELAVDVAATPEPPPKAPIAEVAGARARAAAVPPRERLQVPAAELRAPAAARSPAAVPPKPVDGWGPPMLARVHRAPPSPAATTAAPADRRLDELILSYLAEDLGAKRER